MSERLRDLVREIKKLADVPVRSKGDKTEAQPPGKASPGAPAPSGQGAPTSSRVPQRGRHPAQSAQPVGHGGGGSNISIISMQQALQNLAQTVSSQINLQDAFSGDPRKEKEAKARDAFGVFLTKNYMRNTKVQGIEYDPNTDVKHMPDKQKSANDPTRMSIVMDTMNRVGNPKKGENITDGTWGPRTNAAVRDAFAFASGLLDFVDDVNRFATKKMTIQSYNRQALAELEKFATTDNTLTAQQKVAAAPAVTQHVKSIKKMYEEVKTNILQHPAYQQFIEDSVPFKSYKSSVTPQQVDLVKQNFTQGFTVDLGAGPTVVSIDNLLSLNALKKIIPQGSKVTPEDVVSQIWKQQEKLLGPDRGI